MAKNFNYLPDRIAIFPYFFLLPFLFLLFLNRTVVNYDIYHFRLERDYQFHRQLDSG